MCERAVRQCVGDLRGSMSHSLRKQQSSPSCSSSLWWKLRHQLNLNPWVRMVLVAAGGTDRSVASHLAVAANIKGMAELYPRGPHLATFLNAAVRWSATCGTYKYGDPRVNHVAAKHSWRIGAACLSRISSGMNATHPTTLFCGV